MTKSGNHDVISNAMSDAVDKLNKNNNASWRTKRRCTSVLKERSNEHCIRSKNGPTPVFNGDTVYKISVIIDKQPFTVTQVFSNKNNNGVFGVSIANSLDLIIDVPSDSLRSDNLWGKLTVSSCVCILTLFFFFLLMYFIHIECTIFNGDKPVIITKNQTVTLDMSRELPMCLQNYNYLIQESSHLDGLRFVVDKYMYISNEKCFAVTMYHISAQNQKIYVTVPAYWLQLEGSNLLQVDGVFDVCATGSDASASATLSLSHASDTLRNNTIAAWDAKFDNFDADWLKIVQMDGNSNDEIDSNGHISNESVQSAGNSNSQSNVTELVEESDDEKTDEESDDNSNDNSNDDSNDNSNVAPSVCKERKYKVDSLLVCDELVEPIKKLMKLTATDILGEKEQIIEKCDEIKEMIDNGAQLFDITADTKELIDEQSKRQREFDENGISSKVSAN